MARSNPSPGAALLASWRRLESWPCGKWLFSRILGMQVPYTGKLGSKVLELAPGHVRVELRDRRGVRNHLDSVHAVALTNLGEVSSGLAMLSGLAPGVRGIVVALATEYKKKARGRLVAECRCEPPASVAAATDFPVTAEIRDAAGDVVAVVTATWRLSP